MTKTMLLASIESSLKSRLPGYAISFSDYRDPENGAQQTRLRIQGHISDREYVRASVSQTLENYHAELDETGVDLFTAIEAIS